MSWLLTWFISHMKFNLANKTIFSVHVIKDQYSSHINLICLVYHTTKWILNQQTNK